MTLGWLDYIEPGPEPDYDPYHIYISAEIAIRWMYLIHPTYPDAQIALDDFIAVHWAVFHSEEDYK